MTEKAEKSAVLDLPPERTDDLDLTRGGAGGIVDKGLNKESMESVLFLADNMEKLAAAREKIIIVCLKYAQPGDWVIHGNKANVGYAGAERIASLAGINFANWEHRLVKWSDDAGEAYRHEYECDVVMGKRIVRAFGRYGSRDKFLGFAQGEWRDLEAINEGDVKMAAFHRCVAEGVKGILGIHAMDPEYLKKHGVNLSSAKGVEYKDERTSGAATAEHGEKQTYTGKVLGIETKTGPLEKGKPKWVRFNIMLENRIGYSTFDKALKELAEEAKKADQAVEIEFSVDQKYGPQLASLVKVTQKAAPAGDPGSAQE